MKLVTIYHQDLLITKIQKNLAGFNPNPEMVVGRTKALSRLEAIRIINK